MPGVDNVRVFCFTSDIQMWCLRPYAWLHKKYWNAPVTVAGFTPPDFDLPNGFEFHSIGKFEDYPYYKWSDAVLKFLAGRGEEIFVYMMEDFWLTRAVDWKAINILQDYMIKNPEVTRVDLSTDRLYGSGMRDYDSVDRIDLITNDLPVQYHLSLQAGLWRRSAMIKYLQAGESPHDAEIAGTQRMIDDRALVLGTRQFPVRYLIAVQQGKLTLDGGYQVPNPMFKKDDLLEMEEKGYLDPVRKEMLEYA